jgi:hypothetical protein
MVKGFTRLLGLLFPLLFSALGRAEFLPCERLLLDQGLTHFAANGVRFAPVLLDGQPALVIEPGEKGWNKIARVILKKFGTSLVYAPGELPPKAAGIYSPPRNIVFVGDHALSLKYEGVIFHEISHARTEFRRLKSQPFAYQGRFSAREGVLPFVAPDSVYARDVFFDEVLSYLIESRVLMKSLKELKKTASALEFEDRKALVLNRLDVIEKVIGQVMTSADLLREVSETGQGALRTGYERGVETVVLRFSSGDNVYEAKVPHFRRPEQKHMTEREFLTSFFSGLYQKTREVYLEVVGTTLRLHGF